MRYAIQYYYILFEPSRASELTVLSQSKRALVMRSLSNLAKYLGCYGQWQNIIKDYGFKWKKSNPLNAFLALINNNEEDIRTWLLQVLEKVPRDVAITLGNSIQLINYLSQQNRLGEYYDKELDMLQHFRYPKIFFRNSKNSFISFVPRRILNEVLKHRPTLNHDDLKSRLRKRGFRIRLKDLRKLYATILSSNNLPSPLIDLLQGRTSSSIFLKSYYRPFLKEIKNKVFRSISPLEKEILNHLI